MTNSPIGANITNLLSQAPMIADEVKQSFGCLSPQQLNWKLHPEQWSVGQCLHHLVTANEAYFPTFEKILKGEKKATLWERMPFLPSLFGSMLINTLSPQSTRKLKAPAAFRPASSDIDVKIDADFADQQNRLIERMKTSAKLKLQSIVISSPATSLVTYSLLDAYKIILVHERRHILQGQRVMELSGFPRQPSA